MNRLFNISRTILLPFCRRHKVTTTFVCVEALDMHFLAKNKSMLWLNADLVLRSLPPRSANPSVCSVPVCMVETVLLWVVKWTAPEFLFHSHGW